MVEPGEQAEKEVKQILDEVTGEMVSKNELKKRQKLRANEAKKKEKEEAKAKEQAANPKAEKVKEEVDPTKYTENRKIWIQNQRDAGANPYPHKFHRELRIDELREKFASVLTVKGEFLEEEKD